MATTLLAKKSGPQDSAIATNDDHHETLASDPTISQFPQGTTMTNTSTGFGGGFGNATTNTTSNSSTFGSTSTGGFGSASSSSTSTSSGGFGASAGSSVSAGPSAVGTVQVTQNQAESLKSGGGAMSEGGESTVALDQSSTDWINKKMRPMMGWIYMLTCTCDFVLFPILWSLLQALSHGQVTSQWQPLTLQGAGLYHIAMGAVLGIAAYGRTKEKVAGVA
jgi:hypothetical protein